MSQDSSAEVRAHNELTEGDYENALKILMKAYGTEIFRFCSSFLANKADAQDVLQTVYIQAFQGFKKFSGKSSFRTWLFAIARNRCLDYLKSKKRLDKRVAFVEELPEQTSGNLQSYSDYREDRALSHCLEKFPAIVKSAVLLRFQSDHTYEEIAQLFEEKAGTVQARVVRALPLLRKCLEDNGVTL